MKRMNLGTFLNSESRRKRFLNALKKLKKEGIYQIFVDWHANQHVGMVAHGTISFLSWHRVFIRLFEQQLRIADKALVNGKVSPLSLPYWDWTKHNSNDVSKEVGRIWRKDFLGEFEQWPLLTRTNNMNLVQLQTQNPIYGRPDKLNRVFNKRSLPQKAELKLLLETKEFDVLSSKGSMQDSFTKKLEGAIKIPGFDSIIHNGGHVWVGGHMGRVATSPNDPVFWLHHASVDRYWAKWQIKKPKSKQYPLDNAIDIGNRLNSRKEYPKLNDPLKPWNTAGQEWKDSSGKVLFKTQIYTTKDVLNWKKMKKGLGGYIYDDPNPSRFAL